jgi:two-component system, sensor histidine kinase
VAAHWLLITDYHLEGGESGFDVIQDLRTALNRPIPVVLLTDDTSSAIRKLPHYPNLRLASKPINAEELLTMLRDLLDRRTDAEASDARHSA